MAQTPYPLPRQTRMSDILFGDGTAGPYGPSPFKIFETADVRVLACPAGADSFSDVPAVVTKTSGAEFDTFSLTFASPLPATTRFVFFAARTHHRDVSVFKGGALSTDQLEKELSKQATVISELRRDVNVAPAFQPDFVGTRFFPAYAPGKAIGWSRTSPVLTDIDVVDAAELADEAQSRRDGDDALDKRIQSEAAERAAADAALGERIDESIQAVEDFTIRAEDAAQVSETSAERAQDLVEAATAGFTGYPNNGAYDFGYVADATTYFDTDWGTLA